MNHRQLGRTGLKESEIGLGTTTFAGQCDKATAHQILEAATERGVTFIDTADADPIPPAPDPAGEGHRPRARTERSRGLRTQFVRDRNQEPVASRPRPSRSRGVAPAHPRGL